MVNLAAIVGITGSAIALLLAAFSLGMGQSPFWAERRKFAMVAATAAGFCAFDVALVLDLPSDVVAMSVQIATAFAISHAAAWVRYLAAADQRPLRTSERTFVAVGAAIAVTGLIPGVLLTRELLTQSVDWLGITYRTPKPTVAGIVCYFYLAATLIVVGAGARKRWQEGWAARMPLLAVITLGVLAVNDTLVSAGLLSMPLLLDIAAIGVLFAVALTHQQRFAANVHQLERASTKLKGEVAARTQALLDAQAALAASERLAGLGRLTAGVAHEINNPIAVVRHSLERLRDGDAAARVEAARHIENGLAATERVVRIVRRLLDAGRVGHIEAAHAEPFRVTPVMAQAIAMVGRHLAGAHVSVDADASLTALGDAGLVSQVLENLLVNAAHAFEGRPDCGRIQVRAERVDQTVRIAVIDNGPGVPEEVRTKLFEPFVTTKVIGKGSGLGLAVSKGLMRSQHGDLVLVRTSEAGTEMALTLPWTPLAPPAPIRTPEPPVAPADLTVLIIDDEADVREMLVDACSVVFTATAVGSVVDGLALIEDGLDPDVVLCDLMMPDGGAYEWLQQCELRCSPLASRTVIITGGPATAQDEALLAANAERVLLKPFNLTQLRAMVTRTVESAVARRD